MRLLTILLLALAPVICPADEPALHIQLRFDEALSTDNPKVKPWVLSPRLNFTLSANKPVRPTFELKRGWTVPSWSGVVDSIDITTSTENLRGSLTAHVHAANTAAGHYTINFDTARAGDGTLAGTFTAKAPGRPDRSGTVRGTATPVPAPVPLDPADAVYTLQLDGALPRGEVLTVFLDRHGDTARSAFAFSPDFTRRPLDVDTGDLTLTKTHIRGQVGATRLRTRAPDGGARDTFGTYTLDAAIDGPRVRGTFAGTTVDGQEVAGALRGELRPRRPVSGKTRAWLKLEDGYAGGEMWQNRVFFKFDLADGQLAAGTASNNKGVFEATLTAAALELTDHTVSGTLRSTVKKSGSVTSGAYTFRVTGQRAGDVLYGRFHTALDGQDDHSGYFVGGIER